MERRWAKNFRFLNTTQLSIFSLSHIKRLSKNFTFPLVDERLFETTKPKDQVVEISLPDILSDEKPNLQISLSTNCELDFTLLLAYQKKPMSAEAGTGLGAAVLVGLYILIISEAVDRTFASVIISSLSIAALALVDERPNLKEIISWIDMDTLMLLFGMMILVAITSETGFFDYMAVFVFKVITKALTVSDFSNPFQIFVRKRKEMFGRLFLV